MTPRFGNGPLRTEARGRREDAHAVGTMSTGGIGLVVPRIDPYTAPMVSEIRMAVEESGRRLVVISAAERGQGRVARPLGALTQQCEAAIVHPEGMNDDEVESLLEQHPNVIVVHHRAPRYADRCVITDNWGGAREATSHLLDHGHRNIAVIAGPETDQESNDRYAAFIATMIHAGLDVDCELAVKVEVSRTGGECGAAHLLSLGRHFSALFCLNDEIAAGAMFYLRAAGFVLPRDVSVVGFGDESCCERVYPRLTTIRKPVKEIGGLAAARAIALAEGREVPVSPVLPRPKLIMRDSVARVASPWNCPDDYPFFHLVSGTDSA